MIEQNNFGYIRVAGATPTLHLADPFYNISEMYNLILKASHDDVDIIVFPELSVTGYSCGDLFNQQSLRTVANNAMEELLQSTSKLPVIFAVGIPFLLDNKLYNCALIAFMGKVLGIIPKTHINSTQKRWFTSSNNTPLQSVSFFGQEARFGNFIIQIPERGIGIGTEIGDDLFAITPPSSDMAISGANIIINLAAKGEAVSNPTYRKNLILSQSARCSCAYIYSSAGVYESTTDEVFSGSSIIAENGDLLAQNTLFKRNSSYIVADVDTQKLKYKRINNFAFRENTNSCSPKYEFDLPIKMPNFRKNLYRNILTHPFVPISKEKRNLHCDEIFNIQTAGLAKRLEHTGIQKVYLGVSGGLDSTLALLVAYKTFKLLSLPLEGINGITMPGFGTSTRTYDNSLKLMKALKISFSDIDIKKSSLDHFEQIGHDQDVLDTTYENVQARIRTQLLMNLSNKHGGLVVGTGDLSELALGWCTYNGDHMSMYSVNSGVPKTIIRPLIQWISESMEDKVKNILEDIISTPISPELLPLDKEGEIEQKTEDIIGPYELHDFFLYYFLREGASPDKLLFMATHAFKEKYTEDEMKKWLKVFISRFFSQQFKRSCMPDGPKVGSVSLSPRNDWKMPSDMSSDIWLNLF